MKIALLGYGKMGKEIEQIALDRKHEIVLKVDDQNASSYKREELELADVAIEFSTPDSAEANILKCFDANVPVVVGTTGWLHKMEEVKKICTEKDRAFLYASNFSIGVNIFFNLNEYLAKIMNNYTDYDVNMEEIHHIHKLDSPSGTGITLANQILENIHRKKNWIDGISEKPEELNIESKRIGETPGTHAVYYKSKIDDIEIKHTAHNRKGFALGAVIAAEWLKGKRGIYSMKDVLKM